MSQNVLITGCNRGIGLQFTKHYLNAGANVIAACRKPDAADELNALQSNYPEQLQIFALELQSEEAIQAFAFDLKSAGFEFDLVISNAGVGDNEPFGEWTADAFKLNFTVNAIAPALLAQSLAPILKDGGKLIQLSSGMGSIGLNLNETAPLDSYAASKCALNMLSCRLANHLKPRNISVISLDPGWVRTDMGGPNAFLGVEEAVEKITATIAGITIDDTGSFFDNEGNTVPW